MPVGPELPLSLSKRKRTGESRSCSEDSDDVGPQPLLPGAKDADNTSTVKKARVIGPLLPPSLSGGKSTPMPRIGQDEVESSESDEDFGPSLPPKEAYTQNHASKAGEQLAPKRVESVAPVQSVRDEWMTIAPTSGDWSQRIDPTKLKSRKFNTGSTSTVSRSGTNSWHENPEQKQARLQREVLGVKEDTSSSKGPKKAVDTGTELDSDTVRRMREYNQQRGPSLYDAHQKGKKEAEDDDPSARAFDREKDIGGGLQINATKRKDMLKKSSDFNTRFSSAKYL